MDEQDNEDSPEMSPELQSLEARWALLQPRAARFDRDRLFYLAGRASAAGESTRRASALNPRDQLRRWYWPVSSVVMTGVAAGLLCALILRETGQPRGMSEILGSGAVIRSGESPANEGQAAFVVRPIERASPTALRMRLPADIDRLLDDDWLVAQARSQPEPVDSIPEAAILSPRSLDRLLDERADERRSTVPRDTPTHDPAGTKS